MTQHNLKPITVAILQSNSDNRIIPSKIKQFTWGELKEQYFKQHDIRPDKDGATIIGASFKSPDEATLLLDDEGNPKKDGDGNPIVRRIGENIDKYYLLILDYDDGMSISEAKEKFKDKEYIGYTSHNHDPDNVDKFRIVFPLKTPVSPDEIRKRKDAILDLAGSADKSTLSIARSFYLPSCPEEMKNHAEIWENSHE